jgi:uncharacterized membrane protein YphA (DoxX/SURF4 family)
MSDVAGIVVLVGRILFVIFPAYVSGWMFHVKNPEAAEGYAQAMGFPMPAIAGMVAGLWLIVASVSIAVGIFPDIGSLMLAAFVAPAALYFHAYWKLEDDRSASDPVDVLLAERHDLRRVPDDVRLLRLGWCRPSLFGDRCAGRPQLMLSCAASRGLHRRPSSAVTRSDVRSTRGKNSSMILSLVARSAWEQTVTAASVRPCGERIGTAKERTPSSTS